MRPPLPPPSLALAGLVAAGALLAGCGPPPQLTETPAPPLSPPPPPVSPTSPQPSLPPESPGLPPTAGGEYPEEIAIICDGQPDAAAMLDVLREEEMLAAGADAEVVEGPYCSGDWQYAVVSVPERDPLRMVTRGDPAALELITAGTEVCSVEVRYQAPTGIHGAAGC